MESNLLISEGSIGLPDDESAGLLENDCVETLEENSAKPPEYNLPATNKGNANFRYVIIEYKNSYISGELSERERNAPTGRVEETAFRTSAMMAGFGHAQLVLLNQFNAEDELEGVRWSVGKNSNGIVVKKGAPWSFAPTSKFHLKRFTLITDAEVDDIVEELKQRNQHYELLDNNCEVFCQRVLSQIPFLEMDRESAVQHHLLLDKKFQLLEGAGCRYAKDLAQYTTSSWTYSTKIVLLNLGATIVLMLLIVILLVIWYPKSTKDVLILGLSWILVVLGEWALIYSHIRPEREHDRHVNQTQLEEDFLNGGPTIFEFASPLGSLSRMLERDILRAGRSEEQLEYAGGVTLTWLLRIPILSMPFVLGALLVWLISFLLLDWEENPEHIDIFNIFLFSSLTVCVGTWVITWVFLKPSTRQDLRID